MTRRRRAAEAVHVFTDYTQCKSISHRHTSADHTFSYSGTNGFTSTMDVGSDAAPR